MHIFTSVFTSEDVGGGEPSGKGPYGRPFIWTSVVKEAPMDCAGSLPTMTRQALVGPMYWDSPNLAYPGAPNVNELITRKAAKRPQIIV